MAAPHPQSTTQISTLLHELLGVIFTNCAVGCPDAPLVLGAVSPLFRYIANTTPAAWSSLQLKLDNSTEADARERVRVKAKTTLVSPRAGVGVPAAACKTETHVPAEEMRVPEALEPRGAHQHAEPVQRDTGAGASGTGSTAANRVQTNTMRVCKACASALRPQGKLVRACSPDPEPQRAGDDECHAQRVAGHRSRAAAATTHHPAPRLHTRYRRGRPQTRALRAGLRHIQIEGRIADADRAGEVMTEAESEMGFLPQLAEINLRANVVPLLDQLAVVVPAVHTLHVCDLDGKDGSFRRQRRIRSLPEPDFRIPSIP